MSKNKDKSRPTIDLKRASDTGSSFTDNITGDATPTLSGKAAAGARVNILDGSTLIGTVTADRDGRWSFTAPSLADGEHSLTAVVRDGGSKIVSKPLGVTVDTVAPAAPTIALAAASDTGSSAVDGLTSDATPTLSGTAEARATVTIFDGTTVLGTTVADKSGAWSFTSGTLADGSHSLTAQATDRAGNLGIASAAVGITVDTTAPAAATLDLATASDSGSNSTDNITSDTTPTLTGTAEAGATVTIRDGTTVLGTVIADATGAWSFTSSTLSEGSHSLTAVATDAAGNSTMASSALAVTIDASSATPTLAVAAASDTGRSATDGITSDTAPTLTGTAEAGATVTIKDGSTVLGTVTADSSGNWSFTTATLSAGSHSFTATASDGAGNTSATSTARTVTIDTTAPGTATIDLVAASDTGTSSTDNLTSDTTPTLTGTAEAGATVTIKDGSIVLGTTTADSTGSWTFTTGVLAAGGRLLTATASDAAGNTGTTSSYIAVTIDPHAPSTPTIDLDTWSDTGSSGTDHITSDTTPTLSGTAEAGATITIHNGTTVLGTTTAASITGEWSFTATTLSEGSYTLTATATDSAGNVSSASSTLAVEIDATGPAAPVIGLAATSDTGSSTTDAVTSDTAPTLTGTTEAGATVTIREGSSILGNVTADSSGVWSFTTALSEGSHALRAIATDDAGNIGSESSLMVEIDTSAPAAPTIDLDAGSDSGRSSSDHVTTDTTPTLSGAAAAGATVTIYRGSVVLGTTVADIGGAWSFTPSSLSAGSHAFTATATDAAGNESDPSSILAILIDRTAPSAPVISLDAASDTGSSSSDLLTSETTPTVSGTAEAAAIITILDGTTVLGTTTANGSGAWSFTSPALSEGSHSLTATATDVAGNTSSASASVTFEIDTTGPAAPVIGLAAASDTGSSTTDAVTSDTAPTLTGTSEAGATVTIMDGSTVLGTATADSAGVWTVTSSTLSEGSHSLTATATDVAGNTGSASTALTVEIDTTAPTAPTIALDAASDTGRSSTDLVTTDRTPTLTGTAEAGATVTIYLGTIELGTTVADSSGAWSFTTSSFSGGGYFFRATATDAAGNQGNMSSGVMVQLDRTAPSAPVLSLDAASDTGSSSSDLLTSETTPTLTGTAEADAIITILDGSTVLGTTTANGSGVWSFTTSALSEGSHSLTATATDVAGNTGSASTALTVVIDTTAPATPVIGVAAASDTGRDPADAVTSDTAPTLTGTAEAGATVTITDGSTVLGTATADSAGVWTFTSSTLSEGSHSLTATATDVAGNAGSASSLTVEIDTTPPAAPTIELDATSDTGTSSSDGQTSDAQPLMTGTAEAGATVTILDGTTILGTTVADSSGAWSFVTPTLSDGSHSLTATATDAAGNVSVASSAAALTITRALYNLAALGSSDGYVLLGGSGDRAGIGLGGGGDVNGDGLADLIVGSDFDQKGGGYFAGEAYVIYGGQNPGTITLDSLAAAQGFVIQGDSGNKVGYSVDSAGDVNGDGFDDLIIGAPGAKEAFVVFGSGAGIGTLVNGRQVLDLTSLSASEGYVIEGSGTSTGTSVSSAGDINGDGLDDIIVAGGTANESYVIFGSSDTLGTTVSGRQVVDLSSLSSSYGFTIRGGSGDSAGTAVSSAGDVNGDGFEDIIIGNYRGDDGGTDAGEAYVIFGTASGFGSTIDLDDLSSSQGFVIQGDVGGDRTGWSVSSAGDVDGDGYDDLVVGAIGADTYAGEVYVLFGKAATFGTITGGRDVLDMTGLAAEDGFVIQGDASWDNTGISVSSAGDFNGDGYDDLLIAASWGDDGNTNAGEAYVIFGGAEGFGTEISGRQVIDLVTLTAAQGFEIQGYEFWANAGQRVSGAGDINGDGLDDIIVGAPWGGGSASTGAVYVIYGNALGDTAASVDLSGTTGADDLVGGLGDDVIAGNGGADVLIGGGGDDTISIASANFRRISGGGGTDTLALDGAGLSVDFTQIANSRVSGIERLDLTGTGDNTVKLAIGDIFKFSDTIADGFTAATLDEALVVDGDAGDTLQLVEGTGSWTIVSSSVGLDGNSNGDYDIYEYTVSGDVRGFLAVDSDVTLSLL
jgi:hypothetical protein